MRILFISAFVPSSKTAGQNYSNLLLQELSRKCNVDLVLFRNKKSYTFDIKSSNLHIKKYYTDTFISKLFNSLACIPFFPLFTARFSYIRAYYINKLLEQCHYDIIYLDFSQVFVYSLFFPRKVRSKILYMSHDVITQKYERMGNPFILWWVNRTERFILRGVDNKQRKIYTFSMKDVEYMNNKLSLKANSTNFFINEIVANALPVKVNDEYILFGAWKRSENSVGLLWLLEFWKNRPIDTHERLVIIGGGLDKSVVDLVQTMHNIVYEGWLLDPYVRIANAKALIAPLFQGAGVKVKVIEALACGTPVIGTSVALEGIPAYMDNALYHFESADDLSRILDKFDVDLKTKLRIKKDFISKYMGKNILKEFYSDY